MDWIFYLIIIILIVLIVLSLRGYKIEPQNYTTQTNYPEQQSVWQTVSSGQCITYTFFNKNSSGHFTRPLVSLYEAGLCIANNQCFYSSGGSCVDVDQIATAQYSKKCISQTRRCRTSKNNILSYGDLNMENQVCITNSCPGFITAIEIQPGTSLTCNISGIIGTAPTNVYDPSQRFRVITYSVKSGELVIDSSGIFFSIEWRLNLSNISTNLFPSFYIIPATNGTLTTQTSQIACWILVPSTDLMTNIASPLNQRKNFSTETQVIYGNIMIKDQNGSFTIPKNIYKAINVNPGYVGQNEPVLPPVNTNFVTDGSVIWETVPPNWNTVEFPQSYFTSGNYPLVPPSTTININYYATPPNINQPSPSQIVYMTSQSFITYSSSLTNLKQFFMNTTSIFTSIQLSSQTPILAYFIPSSRIILNGSSPLNFSTSTSFVMY